MGNFISIFVSTTSNDLATFREQVALWVLDMKWHPVSQERFEPDDQTVARMLRKRIAECDAVIHLVGECYGAEPRSRAPGLPRKSYAQIEADLAREMGKRLFVFLLDDGFPYDPHEPEPDELRDLQRNYRKVVASGDHLFIPAGSPHDLEPQIRKLRIEVDKLRKSSRTMVMALSVLSLFILLFASFAWYSFRSTRSTLDARDAIMQIVQQAGKESSGETPESRRQRLRDAVYQIAAQSGSDPESLSALVDRFTAETAANHAASMRDQALAAFAQSDYPKAEKLAVDAVRGITGGPGSDEFKRPLIRDMDMLAASAAENQEKWPQEESYSREALAKTSPETETAKYAKIGMSLGDALSNQDREKDAADQLLRAKSAMAGHMGSLGDDGVSFLNQLAGSQYLSGRPDDCVANVKEAVAFAHRPGVSPFSIEYAWMVMAGVLDKMGKEAEAKSAAAQADEIIDLAPASDKSLLEIEQQSAADLLDRKDMQDTLQQLDAYADHEHAVAKEFIARFSSVKLFMESYSRSLKIYTKVDEVIYWAARAGLILAAVTVLLMGLVVGQVFLSERRSKRIAQPVEPVEPGHSPDPKEELERRRQYARKYEQYRVELNQYAKVLTRQVELYDKWNRPVNYLGATCLISLLLYGSLWLSEPLANRISRAPQKWQELVVHLRSDVEFARTNLPGSDDYILILDLLANVLHDGGTDAATYKRAQAESEADYEQVVFLRGIAPKPDPIGLAKSMEDLAAVLKTEGKNTEADSWVRKARTARSAAPAHTN